MRTSILVLALVGLFIADSMIDEACAEAKKLEIKIQVKVPSKAQSVLDAIDSVVIPIKDSLQLEDLEKALPKKEKAIKKVDKPALSWDADKRQVKFARR